MSFCCHLSFFFNCNISFSCDKTLEDLNEKFQGQHKLLQERNQKDLASWDKEKVYNCGVYI